MSYVIDSKAESIVSRMGVTNKQGLAAFDPAIIMAILSAVGATIVQVIQAISNCNNPTPTPIPATDAKTKKALAGASPMSIINSPGLFHRMKLNVMCRAALIREGVPMKYQYLAADMKQSMLAEGKETNQDEFNQMVAEVAGLGNQQDPWSF